MKPEIGISEKNLKSSVALLSTVLADEMTLYIKTRKSHWNVSGDSFMARVKLDQISLRDVTFSFSDERRGVDEHVIKMPVELYIPTNGAWERRIKS